MNNKGLRGVQRIFNEDLEGLRRECRFCLYNYERFAGENRIPDTVVPSLYGRVQTLPRVALLFIVLSLLNYVPPLFEHMCGPQADAEEAVRFRAYLRSVLGSFASGIPINHPDFPTVVFDFVDTPVLVRDRGSLPKPESMVDCVHLVQLAATTGLTFPPLPLAANRLEADGLASH